MARASVDSAVLRKWIPGRIVKTTPVFDTYWRFAAQRQAIFMSRVAGEPPPWTSDPILASYRFTNVYRASDRVTQYLIRHVIYAGTQTAEEIVFRTLLFKFFNRIETWEALSREVGPLSWEGYDLGRYLRALELVEGSAGRLYSGAYIIPSPHLGAARKYENHLRLLEQIMRDGAPHRIERAQSLADVFDLLRAYPSLGDFLSFQFCIDLNYSDLINFSEMDFVIPGPGARDGIRKCFLDTAGLTDSDVIRLVAAQADDAFRDMGLPFQTLWGRPLQLIDCQNLFCEVAKYARIRHPEIKGQSGRMRIKQKFVPTPRALPQWYPPKWGLAAPATASTAPNEAPMVSGQLPLLVQHLP